MPKVCRNFGGKIFFHLTEVYGLEEKEMENLQDALMAVAREMDDSECR